MGCSLCCWHIWCREVLRIIRHPFTKRGHALRELFPCAFILTICLMAFLAMTGFYAMPVQLPFLLAERTGQGAIASGAMKAGLTLASAFTGLVCGKSSARLPLPMLGGPALLYLSIGLALISSGATMTYSGLIAIGLGMGVFMPTMQRLVLSRTPRTIRGRALDLFSASVFASQFHLTDIAGTDAEPA